MGCSIYKINQLFNFKTIFPQPCVPDSSVQIQVAITGLPRSADPTLHGFHIHQKGDVSGGCASTGGHYNPTQSHHGSLDARPGYSIRQYLSCHGNHTYHNATRVLVIRWVLENKSYINRVFGQFCDLSYLIVRCYWIT